MVRTITWAIYIQNSIFLSFLKNEKIITSPFLILFIFVASVFLDTFVFRHCHRKIGNLEKVNQFTRQKKSLCYLMSSREFKMRQCLRTAYTYRKVGVSNPLVANGFCDPLKFGALHNHFYFILSKNDYRLRVDTKSGK